MTVSKELYYKILEKWPSDKPNSPLAAFRNTATKSAYNAAWRAGNGETLGLEIIQEILSLYLTGYQVITDGVGSRLAPKKGRK